MAGAGAGASMRVVAATLVGRGGGPDGPGSADVVLVGTGRRVRGRIVVVAAQARHQHHTSASARTAPTAREEPRRAAGTRRIGGTAVVRRVVEAGEHLGLGDGLADRVPAVGAEAAHPELMAAPCTGAHGRNPRGWAVTAPGVCRSDGDVRDLGLDLAPRARARRRASPSAPSGRRRPAAAVTPSPPSQHREERGEDRLHAHDDRGAGGRQVRLRPGLPEHGERAGERPPCRRTESQSRPVAAARCRRARWRRGRRP